MPHHDVQSISGEATKRNEENQSCSPNCHGQASFKRLHKKTPIGRNSINTILKNMKENSPREEFDLLRKTMVKEFKNSGFPKCDIINITGHASVNGLDDYDLEDERELQIISLAIDNTSGLVPSRGTLGQLYYVKTTATLCAFGHKKKTLFKRRVYLPLFYQLGTL